MTHTELMPIGVFAKRSGLTASALRFYDDAGLLPPQWVDPATGYRYYEDAQVQRASLLRQLREVGMSLSQVEEALAAEPARAAGLVDEQVARVVAEAAAAQRAASALKSALGDRGRLPVCALPGPALADAVDQVLTATAHDPHPAVLGGIRVEVDPGSLTLTATDRYRLATRTLVPARSSVASWAGTLAGNRLRELTPALRRSAGVEIDAGAQTLSFRMADGAVRDCWLLTEDFPDYRLMLGSLSDVTHRVTLSRQPALRALQDHSAERLGLRICEVDLRLVTPSGAEVELPGRASGSDLLVWFELTTLYPALSQAVGPDLMLDLRGPDQPVTIRSASDGDLTTLVMPVAPDSTG